MIMMAALAMVRLTLSRVLGNWFRSSIESLALRVPCATCFKSVSGHIASFLLVVDDPKATLRVVA